MDQIRISCIFNNSKMCLTWNRWNIIIFLFLLLQGGGHFWKKLVKTVGVLVCLKQHTGSYWLHSGMCRVAEMHYSATKAKRVFSFSTCHIGPNEWINNIVVPSSTIRCTQAVLHIEPEIKIILKNFCGPTLYTKCQCNSQMTPHGHIVIHILRVWLPNHKIPDNCLSWLKNGP